MSSKKGSSPGEPRALRELIREAVDAEPPELPWDRLEARLFAEIDEQGERGHKQPQGAVSADVASDSDRSSSVPEVIAAQRTSEREPSLLPDAPTALQKNSASPGLARGGRLRRWVGAVAVAAAAGLLWAAGGRLAEGPTAPIAVAEPVDVEALPMAPGLPGARMVSSLNAGDVVEAAVGPVVFGEQGVIEWTLSAGSRLVVRDPVPAGGLGVGVHVVELEAGSMRGSLPSTSSGMLVVMAGDTEVASLGPGAVFNVTRSSKRLVMHLERGSASVGTLGQRGAGRAFAAPLVAAFSLDGGVSFEVLEEETAALLPVSPVREARTAESPAPHEPQPRPLAPAVASHRPLELSSGPEQPSAPAPSASVAPSAPEVTKVDPAATISDSVAASTLISCISKARKERQAKAPEGVSVTVSSTLSVLVAEDGSVKGAVFNPPLERDLQGCAVFLLRSKLEPGARSLSIPVNVK